MRCCSKCFADKFLISFINANSKESGKCSFCYSKNVKLIQTSLLTDYFEAFLNIYTRNESGELLNEIIQKDWSTFAIKTNQITLLKSIMQVKKRSELKYKPKFPQNKEIIDKWHLFTEELMHKNRFFPNNAPKISEFEQFGTLLGVVFGKDKKLKFFRARINEEGKKYKIKDLKKPPANKVQNGRANPIGIPYLYVASKFTTAIAEIRGHKGETVSVLEFENSKKLDLFDLRHPKKTISPFERLDDLEFIYRHMPYLDLLGNELSKPVIPKFTNIGYLASQYLCEMIKKIGFHGIIYNSSIAKGDNYVIFEDKRLKASKKLSEFIITEMKFETKPKT